MLSNDPAPDAIPDFANEENKALAKIVQQEERKLQRLQSEYLEHEQRVAVMIEHLKNVDTEILHTQALLDGKRKQSQTEEHLFKLSNKETEKLQDELRGFEEQIFDFQHKIGVMNNEMFNAKERIEDFRVKMQWNEDELEQWTLARQQKDEDHLTLEKYKRADEAKIVSMNVQIQKLSKALQDVKRRLEKEVAETKACQIELDNTAANFEEIHNERIEFGQRLQNATEQIFAKDRQIRATVETVQSLKAAHDEKDAILESHRQAAHLQKNSRKKASGRLVMREKERDRVRQKLFNNKQTLGQQGDELYLKRSELQKINIDLVQTKKELRSLESIRDAREKRVEVAEKEHTELTELVGKAKSKRLSAEESIEASDKALVKAKEQLVKIEEIQHDTKKESIKQNEEIFRLKQQQKLFRSEKSGTIASQKNIKLRIKELDDSSLKQQEMLYQYDFEIQHMLQKVERASGKRTAKESAELNRRISDLKEKVEREKKQKQILQKEVRRLEDSIRTITRKQKLVTESVEKSHDEIERKILEKESIECEIRSLEEAQKEETVAHDELSLETDTLRNLLMELAEECFSADGRKVQIDLSMQERRQEIALVHDMEKARIKVEKEEATLLNKELKETISRVEKLKSRHHVVKGKSQNVDGEQNSQAYYIIKVAQERAEVEQKGDQLSEDITAAEREIRKLSNTLTQLNKMNTNYRKSLNGVPSNGPEAQAKKKLEHQLKEVADELYRKKLALQELYNQKTDYDQHLSQMDLQMEELAEDEERGGLDLKAAEQSLLKKVEAYGRRHATFQRFAQSWREKIKIKRQSYEELEIDIRHLKQEVRAILALLTDLVFTHPEYGETINAIFATHGMQFRPLRSRGRTATPTPRPLSRPSSGGIRLPRMGTAQSNTSEGSSASIVNIEFNDSKKKKSSSTKPRS